MELSFQPHAVERMQERKVSVSEIEELIRAFDGRIRQTKDKSILYKRFSPRSDNLVAIVVVEDSVERKIEVVTVLVNFEVKK